MESPPGDPAFVSENVKPQALRVRDFAIEPYAKPKTVDRQFLIVSSLVLISTAADAESSLHGIHLGLRETNPLFGDHPTRLQYYLLGGSVDLLTIYLSYHYKHVSPSRSLWKMFPLTVIGIHTADTFFNVASIYGR